MGMLSAFSYERNILTSATRLIRNDAFRAASTLNNERRRARQPWQIQFVSKVNHHA